MRSLEEIVEANRKATESAVERTAAQDLYFCVEVLERIAGAVSVEGARAMAAGAIQTIARSRGAIEEPVADAA